MKLQEIVDGLIIAGDYPYYRDSHALWEKKITQIKALGLNTITFYIPWRHHLLKDGNYCFDDRTNLNNRNVKKFIELLKKHNLYAIVRPGPYIHAEVELGGLPDEMSPSFNKKIKPIKDAAGKMKATSEGKELPFPFDPLFLAKSSSWYEAVMDEVVSRYLYPAGPIIGIQIGNEGIFSDINWPQEKTAFILDHYFYKKYVKHFANIIRRYSVDLPILFSVAAPDMFQPLSHWLKRVMPEHWQKIASYGYTQWQGNAVKNKQAVHAIILAAKRSCGINVEENTGFVWDDESYKAAHTVIFHAALHLASGAQGISLYPVVATDCWHKTIAVNKKYLQENIDRAKYYAAPYGEAAPITAEGKKSHHYQAIQAFLAFTKYFFEPDKYINKAQLLIVWPYKVIHAKNKAKQRLFDKEFSEILNNPYFLGKDYSLCADKELTKELVNHYAHILPLSHCSNLSAIPSRKLINVNQLKAMNSALAGEEHLLFIKKHKRLNTHSCFIFNLKDSKNLLVGKIAGQELSVILPPKALLILVIGKNKKIKAAYYKSKSLSNKNKLKLAYKNKPYLLSENIANVFA